MKLCRNEEKVNAFLALGPIEVTIRKKGRSFTVSFHSRVYDSLPLGGFTARTSVTLACPLKALSATL